MFCGRFASDEGGIPVPGSSELVQTCRKAGVQIEGDKFSNTIQSAKYRIGKQERRGEMENKNIAYFSLEKGISAKVHLWSRWKPEAVEVDMGEDGSLQCCRIPEFYQGKRRWEIRRLEETLEAALSRWGCRDWYLQPELAGLLGMQERLPPFVLMQRLLQTVTCWEYLVYIGLDREAWDEGAELSVLTEKYLPRINHFTLVTDRPEAYGEFVEYIYREYGIPTAVLGRMERRAGKDGRTVILDGRRNYRVPYPVLPEGAVYVDLWSGEEKRKILAKMRRDVCYISAVKFLDTLMKNGYNTIVN